MHSRLDGMRGLRRTPGSGASRSVPSPLPRVVGALTLVSLALVSLPGRAEDAAAESRRGQGLAWRGNCVAAVPLLEDAEPTHHRPAALLALADCYVALGELLKAAEAYRALGGEKPSSTMIHADRLAIRQARSRLAKIEQRIPTLSFELAEPYEGLEVYLNGAWVEDPTRPTPVEPHVAVQITARAKGRAELRQSVELEEGERVVRPLRLKPKADEQRRRRPSAAKASGKRSGANRPWIGARFRTYLIPQQVMNLVGDGGRTVLVPGGSLVYTLGVSDPQIHLTLGYANYHLGGMPFKPHGTPDTDYEIIESTLEAAYATVEVTWMHPLDDEGDWQFNYGFGIGVGWMFRGELYRTQAYPPGLVPGDPNTYLKCDGPDRPPGSWAYCNSLDFDANHYNYAEPSWAQGGKRPLIYPWLALPLLGVSARVGKDMMIDFEAAVTDSGFLLGAGARAGL